MKIVSAKKIGGRGCYYRSPPSSLFPMSLRSIFLLIPSNLLDLHLDLEKQEEGRRRKRCTYRQPPSPPLPKLFFPNMLLRLSPRDPNSFPCFSFHPLEEWILIGVASIHLAVVLPFDDGESSITRKGQVETETWVE